MPGRASSPLVRDAFAARRRATLAQQVALAAGPPIAALVFDAYGTLFDISSVEVACSALTAESAAFVRHWRAKQLEYSWLHTLMGRYVDFAAITAEAFDHTVAHFALKPTAATRKTLLASWLTLAPFPEVPETLAALNTRPLAILSNGSPTMLAAVLAHNGLQHAFQAILSVDAVHAYKPNPRVYALATTRLGLHANEILFVSANAWDAIGAKAAGLRVAWCNRTGATLDTHGPDPDLEIAHLIQLVEVLNPQ